jgi:hypothetical protein
LQPNPCAVRVVEDPIVDAGVEVKEAIRVPPLTSDRCGALLGTPVGLEGLVAG